MNHDTPLVGLFWVKEDLSDIAIHYADKVIMDADITRGEDIFPEITHRGAWPTVKLQIPNADKLKFNTLPRGRVEYSAKDRCFVVKTGHWITPSLKIKILEYYKLKNRPIRFDIKSFWDSKKIKYPAASSGVFRSPEELDSGFNTFLTAANGGVLNPSPRIKVLRSKTSFLGAGGT